MKKRLTTLFVLTSSMMLTAIPALAGTATMS